MSGTSNVEHAQACVRDLDAASNGKTRPTAEGRSKKRHSYKPLAKEFRRGGFTFRQIAREGDAAIYEQTGRQRRYAHRQTWSGCSNPTVCYEVIRIRRREGFQIGARFVEPAEVYPNSEAWRGAYKTEPLL